MNRLDDDLPQKEKTAWRCRRQQVLSHGHDSLCRCCALRYRASKGLVMLRALTDGMDRLVFTDEERYTHGRVWEEAENVGLVDP